MGFLSHGRTLGVPLELQREPQGPAPVASGKLSLHSSCEGPLGIPLQSVQGHRASSRVEAGTSGFLSSSDMNLGVPMEFQQGFRPRLVWRHGTQLPSRGVKEVSGAFSRGATGLSHLPLYFESILGVLVESVQGNQAYLEWLGKSGSF